MSFLELLAYLGFADVEGSRFSLILKAIYDDVEAGNFLTFGWNCYGHTLFSGRHVLDYDVEVIAVSQGKIQILFTHFPTKKVQASILLDPHF